MNIILFNGPPGCGKDTAADYILSNFPHTILDRLSMPNKRAFAGTMNAPITSSGKVYGWEEVKDMPSSLLQEKSYRDFQILFSEAFMKPHFGEAIFAKLFVERNSGYHHPFTTIVVPDCGFDIEVEHLQEKMGRENRIFLIRIYRPGCDFSKDSRSYLTGKSLLPDRIYDVDNTGTIEEFHNKLTTIRGSM